MRFTAEVEKPYPWISAMYPPAHPHTSALLLHPWPQCVIFPAVSRGAWRTLLLCPTYTPLYTHKHTQRQLTVQIGEVPVTRLIPGLLGIERHPDSHIQAHLHTHTLTHASNSGWAETESTRHTILVVYLAVNSSAETVWQVVCDQ